MPIVEYKDRDRFKQAVGFLLHSGAGIETRAEMRLIVTLPQLAALREAGLVNPSEQKNGSLRGKKEKA